MAHFRLKSNISLSHAYLTGIWRLRPPHRPPNAPSHSILKISEPSSLLRRPPPRRASYVLYCSLPFPPHLLFFPPATSQILFTSPTSFSILILKLRTSLSRPKRPRLTILFALKGAGVFFVCRAEIRPFYIILI